MNSALPKPQTHFRWIICLIAFSAILIIYMDRQILSLLKPTLQKEYGWSNTDYGLISSCFQGAYAFGLLGFGWFLDRFGIKTGYTISLFCWSLVMGCHAFVKYLINDQAGVNKME